MQTVERLVWLVNHGILTKREALAKEWLSEGDRRVLRVRLNEE